MYYSLIRNCDASNGTGVRVSLFVSGCRHHCKNCFNKETWDFHFGQEFTQDTINQIIDLLKPDYISGLTLLGGDPMEPENQHSLLPLVTKVKLTYPSKNIWCYTGYTYETDILYNMRSKYQETCEILKYIDVLVDGEFKEELKNPLLKFRGSSNQRLIDVQKSLEYGETIIL